MEYTVSAREWRNIFAVPTQVVDEHIRTCGALSLRALLLLLRNGGTAEENAIAAELAMDVAEVRDALRYWVNAGILISPQSSPPQPMPDRQPLSPDLPQTEAPALSHQKGQASGDVPSPEKKDHSRELPPKGTATYRGRPTNEQIAAMMEKDPNIEFLFQAASEKLGKFLHISDRSTLIYLYDWAGIPIDVILMVIQYCCSIGKRQMRYIERVALNWQDAGVNSLETAEEYIRRLEEHNSWAGEVKSAFGIRDRELVEKEQSYINKWYGEYHSSIQLIRLAYERTVERIGKLSFAYIDSILKAWHDKNITTPQEALQEHKPQNEPLKQQPSSPAPRKGRDGLGVPSYDLDEINRLLFEAEVNPQKQKKQPR